MTQCTKCAPDICSDPIGHRVFHVRPLPSNLRGHFPGEFFGSVLGLGKDRNKRYKATGEFRAPKRGEYYLSGAVIQAYRAPNDLSTEYWIAEAYELKPCPCCGQPS